MSELDNRVNAQDTTLTPQELINWVNSKPVGNLLDRTAWDKRFWEITKAQSILFLPTANSIFYGRADFGNGREADQIYFYQNLQATDRAILIEMERQKKASEDYWGGNFLSSPGISDVTKFVTAAAAVAVVGIGTAGLGTAPLAGAGAATEAGTLAGSTGLLSGSSGAAVLTAEGLGAGAVATTGVSTAVTGTTTLSGLLAAGSTLATNYAGTSAAGYLTNELNNLVQTKKDAPQTVSSITNQPSVSPLAWGAIALGLLFFI